MSDKILSESNFITVFHGTHNYKLSIIEKDGLKAGSMGYDNAGWYMVSTDFDSALFHSTPNEKADAIVFEFEVPLTNEIWEGYPYFWPPYNRNIKSKWFALKQPIPSEFIKKVHKIPYDDYIYQKNIGLSESNKKDFNNSDYVYHGTSKGSAHRINKYGSMKPGQASGSPNAPIFFSNKEQYASTYSSRKDSSGGVLFRIKKTSDMKINNSISKKGGYVEYYTFREIPVEEIEIKDGNKWVKFDDFDIIKENVEDEKLDYRIEHLSSYGGQENLELGLYIEDEIIGLVQYTLYNKELTVSNIIVRPEFRRKGYGSKMMAYIKKTHPEFKYRPSMMTDLGAKFVHKESIEEIRKIIKSVLFESVIEETQTGQRDLEKFTEDILKLIAKEVIKEKKHLLFLTDDEGEKLTKIPMVNTLMMNEGGFSEIGDFVNSTNIIIYPTSVPIRGSKSIKAELEYSRPNSYNEEYYKIWLKYEDSDLEEINNIFKNKKNPTETDIYLKLFYIFYSNLLHEIQHAYDAFRSKGKAFNSQLKKDYISAKEKVKMLMKTKSGYDDMTPEEIEAINKSRIAYLNLVHEINARYSQAIQKTQLIGMDFETFDDIKKDWNNVYREFKSNFEGWRHLSDKMKKKLTRRLAKAYQEETEKLKSAEEKYEKETIDEVFIRKLVRKTLKESIENRNFLNWFSGSKVIDSSGEPLVVYHGTGIEFDEFDLKKATQGIIWFTSDKSSIESGNAGAQGSGKIMELYASIKNPAGWDEYDKYMLQQLIDLGYDGVILPESDGHITGIVFEPNQLKSVENNGEWSSSNNIFKESEGIQEVALRETSLPKEVALFIEKTNRGYTFVLYDPIRKNTYGVITVSQRDKFGPDYFVTGVAAEKGFGPFIYELAMMHLSKKNTGLMPSRDGDVRGVAFNVWEQFYKRNDVDKKTIDLLDENFLCDILYGDECEFEDDEEKKTWWNDLKKDDKHTLLVFNSIYSLNRDNQYFELTKRAEEYINKGFDYQESIDMGSEFWDNAYMNESIENTINEALDSDYKKWKRKNVTIRGVSQIGKENSAGARFGNGLYTAFLSNRQMAKEYGKVYFVVGAVPKNPKVFNDTNQAEIWLHNNLYMYDGEKFPNVRRFREEGRTIEDEMLNLGYDGIIITGREMVNFTPGDDVLFFENEKQLIDYYEYNIKK